jgi:hypothetical protein
MKKTITLVLVAAGFLMQAQSGAIDTYLNNKLWFGIAIHDSIVEDYTDSTGALNGDVMQTVTYHAPGLIDFSEYSYGGGSSIDGRLSSVRNGNVITVYEMDLSFGTPDTVGYAVFHQNASSQDTLIEGYYYDGASFNKEEEYRLSYDAQGLMSLLRIKADDGSGTLIDVGRIETFRSANRIDSGYLSYDVAGTNFIVQKLFNTYNGAKQTKFEVFSLEDFVSNTYAISYEYFFSHDASNKIVEGVAFAYDANGDRFFDYRTAYLRRNGSNVSVEERSIPQVQLYPNPAKEQVRVEGKSTFAYSVVDTQGMVVAQGKSTNGTIDVSALAVGIYQLRLESEGHYQATFVKQ